MLAFNMSRLEDDNRRRVLAELLRPVAVRLERAGASAAARIVRDAASELLSADARLTALDEREAEKRRDGPQPRSRVPNDDGDGELSDPQLERYLV